MLSKSAFNALLKTLEEPPERVVFIFATTESDKIPETILSRCQCFEFKPLTHKQIIQQLQLISEQEGIAVYTLSLEEIAKNGAGSMRDAQSLLDQVVAFSGKEVTPGSVEAVLGIVGQKTLEIFIDAIRAQDCSALFAQVQDTVNAGKDLSYICRDLADYVRNLLVVKMADAPEKLVDAQAWDLEVLKRQAENFHADELHQIFSLLTRTEVEMKRSSLPQQVFEMALFRLVDVRPFQNIDDLIKRIGEMEDAGSPPAAVPAQAKPAAEAEKGPAVPVAKVQAEQGAADVALWEKVKAEICARKPVFLHYLESCQVVEFSDSVLHLAFQDPYTRDLVEREENRSLIAQAVRSVSGGEVRVGTSEIKAPESQASGQTDEIEKKKSAAPSALMTKSESEIIQQALDVFGGVLMR